MQNVKTMKKNTIPNKLKEIKNDNRVNQNLYQNPFHNQNLNENHNINQNISNKLIKFNQQVNPKRSKSKNGSRKESSSSKIKIVKKFI
jgi:hypothetical protein